jgi:lysine 2,3-aminomutase
MSASLKSTRLPANPKPLTSIDDLEGARLVRSSPEGSRRLQDVSARYSVAITPAMVALVDRNDPEDPIARQFVPDIRELKRLPEEFEDPIADRDHSPVAGIVHRYPDRVLLKVTHACPVYCRFCFRREMVGSTGSEGNLSTSELKDAFDYIRTKPTIREVILTGGDPFILSSRRVAELTAALSLIEHLDLIRWHTRVPVVDPSRITGDFIASLRSQTKAVFVAIHANHPRELTDEAGRAIAKLADAGIVLVSQSVLLRGVNDSVEVLEELMRTFLRHRVKPYYLHHPDMAPGTSHFRLSLEEGRTLVRELRKRSSGLAQPTYMLEEPGGGAKWPISLDS